MAPRDARYGRLIAGIREGSTGSGAPSEVGSTSLGASIRYRRRETGRQGSGATSWQGGRCILVYCPAHWGMS